MRQVGSRQGHDGPERLLTAARRLFARRGFLGVSVGELVAAATVSRPVLYYHFGSKEGLYQAAVQETVAEFDAEVERAAGGRGAIAERIARVCRVHAAALLRSTPLPGQPGSGAAEGSEGADARLRRTVAALRELVAAGLRTGELERCDTGATAIALAGATAAAALLTGEHDDGATADRTDDVLAVVLGGCRGGAPVRG